MAEPQATQLGARVVVIVPGHAFVGVRLGPHSPEILYLDSTVLPKVRFKAAVRRAGYWLKKTADEEELTVDVAAARALGIYPMPVGGPEPALADASLAEPESARTR